jgi:acetyltransferase-like isoleucine patch superfamily enzyme
MTWLTELELEKLGVKFGKNVKVDSSCVIACDELEIGDNSRIDAFCFLSGKIKIGKHVHIAVSVTLSGNNGIKIGDFVGIAAYSYAFTADADYVNGRSLTNPTIPKQFARHNIKGEIILEDHVLVGAHSSIFPNAIMHEGAIFGQYSIIKGEFEEWKLYTSPMRTVVYKRDRPREIILEDAKKILSESEKND